MILSRAVFKKIFSFAIGLKMKNRTSSPCILTLSLTVVLISPLTMAAWTAVLQALLQSRELCVLGYLLYEVSCVSHLMQAMGP